MPSLSNENKSKLNMSGVYKCELVLEWLPKYKRNEPYHCCNWMFRPQEYNGIYYMIDTYWSSGNFAIELTDENFVRFEFVCDMDEVRKVSHDEWRDYDEADRYFLALDSGGWRYSNHYYVKKDAKKSKQLVLARLNFELRVAKIRVEDLEREIKKVEDANETD